MSEKDINKHSKSNRGGAREGAGRPVGSKNKISKATALTVLEKLYDTTGLVYEDLLIEDFVKARHNDPALAHRYHQLLANKLMPDLNSIELEDGTATLEAKAEAFAEALKMVVERDPKYKPE